MLTYFIHLAKRNWSSRQLPLPGSSLELELEDAGVSRWDSQPENPRRFEESMNLV